MGYGSSKNAWLEEETARRYKIFAERTTMYQELSRFMLGLADIRPGMQVLPPTADRRPPTMDRYTASARREPVRSLLWTVRARRCWATAIGLKNVVELVREDLQRTESV